MNVEYHELPVRHLVIDNFMSSRAANKCLAEFIELKPFYKSAGVVDDVNQPNAQFRKDTVRDNSVVMLNDHFRGKEGESFILNAMHDKLLNKEFLRMFDSLPGLFPIMGHVNSSDTVLSRYGMCDFYGLHNDQIKQQEQRRVITAVYYVNKPDAKFSGGELSLYSKDLKNHKKIVPKHNRLVVFESKQYHAVESVILNGSFDEGRFSVNFWLGFDGAFKFK